MLRTDRPLLVVSTLIQRRMGHADSGSAVAAVAAVVAVRLQVSLDGAVVVAAVGGLVAAIASVLIA